MQLTEQGVRRRQFMKARIRVMNAASALVRRALGWQPDLTEAERNKISRDAQKIMAAENPDTLPPELAAVGQGLSADIATAREMAFPGEVFQNEIEREMRKIARQLPVWSWAKDVHGLSDLGVAIIVAEAGNLSRYPTAGHLRKRLGLAPMQKDGETRAYSQWRLRGGLSAEEWTAAGYKPQRRAMMFSQVGGPIIGFMAKGYRPPVGEDIEQNAELSEYQKVFVRRLRYEAARDPEMRRPDTAAGKESYSRHCAMRAQRYTEQRLLKHLWQAWRRTEEASPKKAKVEMSVAEDSEDQSSRVSNRDRRARVL
jgi:hypothetical protein